MFVFFLTLKTQIPTVTTENLCEEIKDKKIEQESRKTTLDHTSKLSDATLTTSSKSSKLN